MKTSLTFGFAPSFFRFTTLFDLPCSHLVGRPSPSGSAARAGAATAMQAATAAWRLSSGGEALHTPTGLSVMAR